MSGQERDEPDAETIADEVAGRAWLDLPPPAAAPPEGDLPDDFAVRSRRPGLWSRLRRALSGR